jgi:hypothetical protein
MAQKVTHSRRTTASTPSVLLAGVIEYVAAPDNTYIAYLFNNSGQRIAPAVMDHVHDISDVDGLQVALDGKAISTHVHSNATTSSPGFMSAADKIKLDAAINYTHPDSGVAAGTYRSVTVNAQGHVTAGTNPTTLAGYGITDQYLSLSPTSGFTNTAASGVNMNSIVVASAAYLTGATNTPAGATANGYAVTYTTGSTSAIQMYFDPTIQGGFWFRRKNTSTVYAWEKIATEGSSFASETWNAVMARGATSSYAATIGLPGGSRNYLLLQPDNYGTGVPRFSIAKGISDNLWQVYAHDGTSAMGVINLNAANVQHNGVDLVTTARVIGTGSGLVGGGNLGGNLSLSVNFGNAAGTVAQGNDFRIVNGNAAYLWGNHAGLYAPISHALTYHSDVNIASPATGQLLRYNGTSWVNWTPTFSSTDTWDNVMVRGATSSVAATIGLAAGSRNYLLLQPANYGTGVPRFSVAKGIADNLWQVYAHDGTSAMGVINLNAANVQHNGVDLVTTARVIGTGSGLVGGGNLGGNLSLSVNFGNAAGTVAQGNDFRIVNGNAAYLWGNHAGVGYITAASSNTLTNKSGNISMWTNNAGYTSNAGTVTQVGLLVPTGFDVLSTPVTGSGNLQFGFAAGYSLVSSGDRSTWNANGSKWTTSGSNIYRGSGTVAIGRTSAAGSSQLSVQGDIHTYGYLNAAAIVLNGPGNTSILYDTMIGSGSLHSSALFQINSTTKGMLIPRMTCAQKTAISSPEIGLKVFQTDAGTTSAGSSGYGSSNTGLGEYVFVGVSWFKVAWA